MLLVTTLAVNYNEMQLVLVLPSSCFQMKTLHMEVSMLLSTAMGVFNIEVTMLLATPLAVSYNEIRQ